MKTHSFVLGLSFVSALCAFGAAADEKPTDSPEAYESAMTPPADSTADAADASIRPGGEGPSDPIALAEDSSPLRYAVSAARLNSRDRRAIHSLATEARLAPGRKIQIDADRKPARKRAAEVARLLRKEGVASDRIEFTNSARR